MKNIKTALNILAKIGVGILINLIALLSAVLNVLEFLKAVILKLFEIPEKVIFATGALLTVTMGIYYFFIYEKAIDWKIGMFILTTIIICLATFALKYVALFASALLTIVFTYLSVAPIILILNTTLISLFDKYFELSPSGTRKCERILVLLSSYMIHYLDIGSKKAVLALRVLAYPLITALVAWFGYWVCFVDAPPISPSDPDFLLYVGLVIAIGLLGVYIAHAVALSLKDALEENDFGLDDIILVYIEAFTAYEDNAGEDSPGGGGKRQPSSFPGEGNPYYDILSRIETLEELKKAYRLMAKELHPDTAKNLTPEEACQKMVQLNEAYAAVKHNLMQKEEGVTV